MRGFTLIEIMVAMSVVAILACMSQVTFLNAMESKQIGAAMDELTHVETDLTTYVSVCGNTSLPGSLSALPVYSYSMPLYGAQGASTLCRNAPGNYSDGQPAGEYVSDLTFADGSLTATLSEGTYPALRGTVITITPSINTNGVVTWRCAYSLAKHLLYRCP